MGLSDYLKKRKPKSSHEPSRKKIKKKSTNLSFVIQKHAARKLHFDFRLELEGVLKSWAIPKGPSLDPKVKRLAIQVDDHPLEYGSFEGIIPQGHYGAGKVEIWDKGTYKSARDEGEKALKKDLAKGELKIILSGKKLKGEFVLVRIKKDPKKNQWLLIKAKDNHSLEDTGLVSNPKKILKSKMPHQVSPMLATLVDAPFDNPNWIFEVKWDGYRAIAEITEKKIELYSRNFKSFKTHFPSIAHALEKVKETVILDGEIVALDQKGRPSFQLLQQYLKSGKGDIRYYIFDLLYYEGQDLREVPLLDRKRILEEFMKKLDSSSLLYCDHIAAKGKRFFKEEEKLGLEGMIGKKKDSLYSSSRSKEWVKVKTHKSQEAIIVGYTKPKGGRKKIGALLLAVNKNKKLKFIGHVGTGFNEQSLNDIYKKLQPLVLKKCPLEKEPKTNTPAVWVKPIFVCEVTFTEQTQGHMLRHPTFKGLREDKQPKEVMTEKVTPERKGKNDNSKQFLSHQDKIFWKKAKYTKGDLIQYYSEVSTYLLPHLKNRPLVMHRFPDGTGGEDFFQKEAPDFLPEWIKTAPVKHSEKVINYIMIQDKKSLAYIANLGSIELHLFLSRISNLEKPDYLVLDLDPVGIPFKQVVHIAKTLHDLLEEIRVPNFCKTSGKRGLHIYIPLGGTYTYKQSQSFAELLARVVNQKLPKTTSLVRSPAKRQKKVYIDYLQNSRTKTVVAPYSVRPTPEATVSTPLDWSEVNDRLNPKKFNMKTIAKRLKEKGDLFKTMGRKKANIKSAVAKLEKLIS